EVQHDHHSGHCRRRRQRGLRIAGAIAFSRRRGRSFSRCRYNRFVLFHPTLIGRADMEATAGPVPVVSRDRDSLIWPIRLLVPPRDRLGPARLVAPKAPVGQVDLGSCFAGGGRGCPCISRTAGRYLVPLLTHRLARPTGVAWAKLLATAGAGGLDGSDR